MYLIVFSVYIIVFFYVLFVLFYVLSVYKFVLYYCHRVSTQFHLKTYYIISYHMLFVPKWFLPSGVPINNMYKEDKFIPIHAMKT
jgi:hypothetical protein